MSGGVDSAVALLKAGPDAVGVTLQALARLKGPDAERACCSPAAVIAAREACHRAGRSARHARSARGVPARVVEPFVAGYASRRDANPCIRCNGSFRFAELLAFADRVGAAKLATGHYARIVERDGGCCLREPSTTDEGSELHARGGRPGVARAAMVPARRADQGGDARRGAAAGLAAASRAESQEACFLGRRRLPALSRAQGARAAARGASSTRPATEVGSHEGFWHFTPGQRRGLGVSAAEPAVCDRVRREPRTPSLSARARRWHGHASRSRDACHAGATRVEAKLRYRSPAVPATVEATPRGFEADPRRAGLRRRPRAGGGPLRRGRDRRFRSHHLDRPPTKTRPRAPRLLSQ